MQEKDLFEYAVIRVVPQVEREEFINVGVILFCKAQQFLEVKYKLDSKRVLAFSCDVDLEALADNLNAIEQISRGKKEGGSIAQLDRASRFRWLTAKRSTVIQTAEVHPGYTENANETLEKLFSQLVL